MTRPKWTRPRVKTQTKVVDPAIASIDAQLAAFQAEEQATVVDAPSPLLFAAEGPALVFEAGTSVAEAFASSAAGRSAAGAFGPAGTIEHQAKATDAFVRPERARPGVVVRHILLPPPNEPAPEVRFWLPFCEFLSCFENAEEVVTTLWRPGQGWNFSQAHESMGYGCAQESRFYGSVRGHLADDEGMCPDHWLYAGEARRIEDTLVDCDVCVDDDFPYDMWEETLPLMAELRETALATVEKVTRFFANSPISESYFYRVAGISARDAPVNLARGIVEAVKEGPHDRGLAAAWADYVVRDWPEQLGPRGEQLEAIFAEMDQYCHMPPQPSHNVMFEALREPVTFQEVAVGTVLPRLTGEYVIRRAEYHSALGHGITTSGFMGWRALYVVPYEPGDEALLEPCDHDPPCPGSRRS